MTKEEKINEAWGENFKEKVDENGWIHFGYACNGWDDVEDWLKENNLNADRDYYEMTYYECDNGDLVGVELRHKSLKGIESNNGWIKVESEDDLPKESGVFEISVGLEYAGKAYYNKDFKEWSDYNDSDNLRFPTHYQPIQMPKPPIY